MCIGGNKNPKKTQVCVKKNVWGGVGGCISRFLALTLHWCELKCGGMNL